MGCNFEGQEQRNADRISKTERYLQNNHAVDFRLAHDGIIKETGGHCGS